MNAEAVRHVRELIDARQYVLDSDWGETQPDAAAQNDVPGEAHVGAVRRRGTSG